MNNKTKLLEAVTTTTALPITGNGNTSSWYFISTPLDTKKLSNVTIDKVVFVDNKETRVFWSDGSETRVKVMEGDVFNPYDGIAWAIAKKYLGQVDESMKNTLKKAIYSYSGEYQKEQSRLLNTLGIEDE